MHRIFLLPILIGWLSNSYAEWVIETTPLGVLISIENEDFQLPRGSIGIFTDKAHRLEISVSGPGNTVFTSLKKPLLLHINGGEYNLECGKSLVVEDKLYK